VILDKRKGFCVVNSMLFETGIACDIILGKCGFMLSNHAN
jgi:hypothetical protein